MRLMSGNCTPPVSVLPTHAMGLQVPKAFPPLQPEAREQEWAPRCPDHLLFSVGKVSEGKPGRLSPQGRCYQDYFIKLPGQLQCELFAEISWSATFLSLLCELWKRHQWGKDRSVELASLCC